MTPRFVLARALALAVPATLIAGALLSQHVGGLYPCEMCLWQRWPHYAAIVLALGAFLVAGAARTLVWLAALAIAASGAIGVFHAGVEYGWWEGITACTSTVAMPADGDLLGAILAAPMIRCDVAQWELLGISLAGWNALFSLGGAIAIFALMRKEAA
ncbi:disulfide bond formation protein B [Sphingomonas baiyangensis]|uniref:Disulfide bond formation protein B n=1 Tax=Sphingomonas baiyangensis TaxID=2572576 RepID=A0A4U1L923_9SPHN|nr:disulfide bond formation protein B [Sphingomonas baiyangensis]TKD52905.1 disulfide bond formation protein B [Sphingomonas baiyangensis]